MMTGESTLNTNSTAYKIVTSVTDPSHLQFGQQEITAQLPGGGFSTHVTKFGSVAACCAHTVFSPQEVTTCAWHEANTPSGVRSRSWASTCTECSARCSACGRQNCPSCLYDVGTPDVPGKGTTPCATERGLRLVGVHLPFERLHRMQVTIRLCSPCFFNFQTEYVGIVRPRSLHCVSTSARSASFQTRHRSSKVRVALRTCRTILLNDSAPAYYAGPATGALE